MSNKYTKLTLAEMLQIIRDRTPIGQKLQIDIHDYFLQKEMDIISPNGMIAISNSLYEKLTLKCHNTALDLMDIIFNNLKQMENINIPKETENPIGKLFFTDKMYHDIIVVKNTDNGWNGYSILDGAWNGNTNPSEMKECNQLEVIEFLKNNKL